MTNEEKAYQLYNELSHKCDSLHYGYVVDALVQMAEWKDQQYADIIKEESNTSYESGLAEGERKAEARFKEYLEKKKADNPKTYRSDWKAYENDILHDIINEIINELFKED